MTGEQLSVDYASIERSLAELWRGEGAEGEHAVTRAALWNVVAHTSSRADHNEATEVLARVAALVPQRSLVIRADPRAGSDIAAWISANCHMVAGEKQICSESVAIAAGGDRVNQVPPLVEALLLPDMPVALWWVGDIPNDRSDYVARLLHPADRFIVDSRCFDALADLQLLQRLASATRTAPADLAWARLEEWRAATASVFDGEAMRGCLRRIRSIRLAAVSGDEDRFGTTVESLYYAAWIGAQTGTRPDLTLERMHAEGSPGAIAEVHLEFDRGDEAVIARDRERGILYIDAGGTEATLDTVARMRKRRTDDLIIRQLKHAVADKVYLKVLPLAVEMASRLTA